MTRLDTKVVNKTSSSIFTNKARNNKDFLPSASKAIYHSPSVKNV